MFGARAYAQVGLESGVNSASPHRLIVMLYAGAIEAIRRARLCMESGQVEMKGDAIGKALRIVNEGLALALDKKQGGELAERLLGLYDYIGQELVLANVKNDATKLDECLDLLENLKSAWEEIGNPQTPLNVSSTPL
ncbi:MAG: flagellar export chaperone FliS [Limnobacter sp.]|nr:flagellar export chaperone FliS [Limnobacter sp.]